MRKTIWWFSYSMIQIISGYKLYDDFLNISEHLIVLHLLSICCLSPFPNTITFLLFYIDILKFLLLLQDNWWLFRGLCKVNWSRLEILVYNLNWLIFCFSVQEADSLVFFAFRTKFFYRLVYILLNLAISLLDCPGNVAFASPS